MKNRAVLISHALAALLMAGAVAASYGYLDRPAAIWARGLDPQTVRAARVVTTFGYSAPYLLLLSAACLVLRRRGRQRPALFALLAVALSGIASNLIKCTAGRWRPDPFFETPSHYGFDYFQIGYARTSFPSGHATTAGAVACVLALLFPRWRALWFGLAALVGASRVLTGSHFPGDVVAGLWLGVVVTLGVARWYRFRDPQAATAPGDRGAGEGV